jgi:hypothetical protein
MADKTYGPGIYNKDGGDTLVIGPNGSMENQNYGAVTQITSRATGVTLSTLAGTITTDPTSLAAGAEITFTVTNTKVAATDTVVCCVKSGGTTPGSTQATVSAVAAGSFDITINNLHASVADVAALVINFYVLKANA